MQITHVIDKFCKTPTTTISENADYWYRSDEDYNSNINAGFARHEEPFEKDLP